jgi:hypothetical protein
LGECVTASDDFPRQHLCEQRNQRGVKPNEQSSAQYLLQFLLGFIGSVEQFLNGRRVWWNGLGFGFFGGFDARHGFTGGRRRWRNRRR